MIRYYADTFKPETISGTVLLRSMALYESDYVGPEVYHEVHGRESERLDNLSYAYFETPEYWRAIAIHNRIHDPFFEIQSGQVLRIPLDLNLFRESFYRLSRWPQQ